MRDLNILLSFVETATFFQFELLALLASLVVSLFVNQSLPYFAVSAICFLTSFSALSYELLRGTVADTAPFEATAAALFTGLFTGKLIYVVATRFKPTALKSHAATTLACSIFLSIKAASILRDTARPVDLVLDRCTLTAVGFAAMHLLAALLQLHDRTCAVSTQEQYPLEKTVEMV